MRKLAVMTKMMRYFEQPYYFNGGSQNVVDFEKLCSGGYGLAGFCCEGRENGCGLARGGGAGLGSKVTG